MKYSEAKAIIKCLHEDGWRKYKGIDEYKKTWTKGDLHYRQFVTFFELSHLYLPVKELLQHFNEKAERKLEVAWKARE